MTAKPEPALSASALVNVRRWLGRRLLRSELAGEMRLAAERQSEVLGDPHLERYWMGRHTGARRVLLGDFDPPHEGDASHG